MVSNAISHRRTMLRRPLVCLSKKIPPVPPIPGTYWVNVVADSNQAFPSQDVGFEIEPETTDLPPDDPVQLDYFVDDGDLTGPLTIPNQTSDYGNWTGSEILGDHWLYVRATFSNGGIAWGSDVVEVMT